MNIYETDLHLTTTPFYRFEKGIWRPRFLEAVSDVDLPLTFDVSSILSILRFGYCFGERTIFNEIKTQPWLSFVTDNKEPLVAEIPQHNFKWESTSIIAKKLIEKLLKEAEEVCRDKKQIILLLTGGLDSRIIAGILNRLYLEDKLPVKPRAITWGIEYSRDVEYAKKIAEILGWQWEHINLTKEDLYENTVKHSLEIGSSLLPIHLHKMQWFNKFDKNYLVIAGSYGDSIGRAEYSGKHLTELNYLKIINPFGFIRNNVFKIASDGLENDLNSLYQRSTLKYRHVLNELVMQGFYMRRLINLAMTSISNNCTFYQMFTHPNVYSYMFSLHPCRRNNDVYANLLELLNPSLARLPWARTNRALKGKTMHVNINLKKNYHNYLEWGLSLLDERLGRFLDIEWFESTNIFNAERIKETIVELKQSKNNVNRENIL